MTNANYPVLRYFFACSVKQRERKLAASGAEKEHQKKKKGSAGNIVC